jgi:hypothetical protein
MTREHSSRTESRQEVLVREVNDHIREKYPVKKLIVNEILEQMHTECQSSSGFSVVERFVDLAIDFAGSHGMEKRKKNDTAGPWNTPEILSAISRFEKGKDAGITKQLPLSRYLGILAIGELASVRKSINNGWRVDKMKALIHIHYFGELVNLQQKLLKVGNRL